LEICLSPKVSSVGFKALATLGNLQELLTSGLDWEQQQEKFVPLWFQFLPHLRLAGHSFRKYKMDACNGYHNAALLQKSATLMNLEELALSGYVDAALSCQLPQVRALHLHRTWGDLAGLCDRFHNLSTIIFDCVDMEQIKGVLQHIGQRLRSLALGSIRQKLMLANVVSLCPNLEILTLQYRCGGAWNLPAGCLSFLEDVHLDMQYKEFPPGFIVKVSYFWKLNEILFASLNTVFLVLLELDFISNVTCNF
jgi:hypothetical protein